jgi:hypothetical protein
MAVWALKDILEMGAVDETDTVSTEKITIIPVESGPRIITLQEVK